MRSAMWDLGVDPQGLSRSPGCTHAGGHTERGGP